MSQVECRVGPYVFRWKRIPRGAEGVAQVEIQSNEKVNGEKVKQQLEVHWKRDLNGIWISLPHRLIGLELNGRRDDDGPMGYEVSQRGSSHEWSQIFLSYGSEEIPVAACTHAKALRIKSQMPGKIIRVLVQEGEIVQKGQSLVVMEAMKMENEIRASQGGKVTLVKVTQGQTIETGADLVVIES